MINLEHLIAFGSTVALSGLALSAQAPTQSQPPKPALGAVTLTGCIKPWEGSTMGAPPAATTTGSAAAREYVLTGAEPSAAPEKTATADAQAHSTYLLKTAPPVDLAQHVSRAVGRPIVDDEDLLVEAGWRRGEHGGDDGPHGRALVVDGDDD